ncbi:MAG: polysaccharide deacetylase family protein, partial [Oscillospiraceae bacterium]
MVYKILDRVSGDWGIMYWGSVKFFKHFILMFIVILIVLPIVVAMSLLFKSQKLSDELNTVRAIADKATEVPIIVGKVENATQNSQVKTPVVECKSIDYQLDYPDLYAVPVAKKLPNGEKKVYLTFDDGPSKQTPKILDILDQYQIKATFFVVYKNDEFSNSMYKEIVNRGHTIGVHSASHNYNKIYASVDTYLEDFNKMYLHIYELTGVKIDLFRFPGGSINSHNQSTYQPIIAEMLRRGFTFHDWNIESGDTTTKATEKTIYNNVVNNVVK